LAQRRELRPLLPQVKVIQAVLDPLGMPLATDVVSGERADDPLYIPCIERVQASMGRHGLLYVGDCKMAARDTRARIAAAGGFFLCPPPPGPLDGGGVDPAPAAVGQGGGVPRSVRLAGPPGATGGDRRGL